MSRIQACRALRRDPGDRPGGPGGPGAAQPDRAARACERRWLRFRSSSATGSAATSPSIADIVERAQTTEYLNRTYESRKHPGLRLRLWINYSRYGNNLRHTPEICLPSGGWTKIESQTRVLEVPVGSGPVDPGHAAGLRPR